MKLKKHFTSMFILILVFLCILTHCVQASSLELDNNYDYEDDEESEIEKTIDADEGGLFEKIIAKMIRRNSRRSFRFNY